MAFIKTSVGVTPVKTTEIFIPVGTKKDNLFWDGTKWVTEQEWLKLSKDKSHG